jgi:hypothetical protein
MAGREHQGNHWVLTWELDLQLPIVCAGFRSLSLASVQNLGHRNACLMRLLTSYIYVVYIIAIILRHYFCILSVLVLVSFLSFSHSYQFSPAVR